MNTALQLDSVTVRFADGTQALDEVTLAIPRGEFCVLLGPSGAGKSTLLKVINGLCRPDTGDVTIDGARSWPKRPPRRSSVATIHQSADLVMRASVLDNVLCGALAQVSTVAALGGWFSRSRKRRACELLQQVGLSEAHVYRRASELSGGQQQRVGVARAFMSAPQLVLADEPVASLDPRMSREILALLKQAAIERGATVLCSLHDVSLAREFADRIVGMRAGRIVFDRSACELDAIACDELYAAAA